MLSSFTWDRVPVPSIRHYSLWGLSSQLKEGLPTKKSLLPLTFIAIILAISITTLVGAPPELGLSTLATMGHPVRLAKQMTQYFKENLSIRQSLQNLSLQLRLMGGNREINGIFLANDGLIKNFSATTDTSIYQKNTQSLLEFVQTTKTPCALVLIPTACVIYQDQVPDYAPIEKTNQKLFIEETTKAFAGLATGVDVYTPLYDARDRYLYYRTDDNLTTEGGFVVYQTLAKRLGLTPKTPEDFALDNLGEGYYGPLYDQWGYGGVKPDTIMAWRYISQPRAWQVDHWLRYENRTYYSLYPTEAVVQGEEINGILGGLSPKITITTLGSGAKGSLLVLGDRTTLSYLPFLAIHYQTITFADTSLLTDSEVRALNPEDYDQVLFSYSLDTYLNTSEPYRASSIGSTATQ